MRTAIIGTGETRGPVPEEVIDMTVRAGIYVLHDPNTPNLLVPVCSLGGKLFSMKIDVEINPSSFLDGTHVSGPHPTEMSPAPLRSSQ